MSDCDVRRIERLPNVRAECAHCGRELFRTIHSETWYHMHNKSIFCRDWTERRTMPFLVSAQPRDDNREMSKQ